MQNRTDGGSGVKSVERAFLLLEALARENHLVSLTQLSEKTGLHPSTVHRLLGTLIQMGYVFQEPSSRQYGVGIKVLEIARGVNSIANLQTVAHPFIRELAEEVEETVNLVVREGTEALIIDRVESEHLLKFSEPVGMRIPLHGTAAGKAILAFLPAEEVETLLDGPLVAFTPNTIVEHDQLFQELARIRNRGHSIDDEERALGVRCVGVPILDHSDRVIASISIAGPINRMTRARLRALAERGQKVVHSIALALNHETLATGG